MRAGRHAFEFPTLQSSHAVRILKLPFEQFSPAIGCDYHRERDLALAEFPCDLYFLANGEIGSAAMHLEMRIHFRGVPEGHALRNEENEDFVGRDGKIPGEFEVCHQRMETIS